MQTLILIFLLSLAITLAQQYRTLGEIAIEEAAFLNIDRYNDTYPWAMTISTFSPNPLSYDSVFIIQDVAESVRDWESTKPTLLTDAENWPNEARLVPWSIFKGPVISIAGGFLLPGKSTGQISLYDMSSGKFPVSGNIISESKFEWFYHRVRWFDVNNDGLMDIIAARAIKPLLFGNPEGELVWYENPGKNALTSKWKLHHIVDNPDIFFELCDLDGDDYPEIVSAEFFSERLVLYKTDSWNGGKIASRVIDDTIGPLFDVKMVDLNMDGKLDLLVTNHNEVGEKGGVWAYEIPDDLLNGEYKRHTITTGFEIRQSGVHQAVPGDMSTFHPTNTTKESKPWILLSGDGSQESYLLVPESNDPTNWNYKRSVIDSYKATVGQIAVEDVNHDGYADFFVPAYDTGKIVGYTYSPKK